MTVNSLFRLAHNYGDTLKCGGLFAVCLGLAKERLVLLCASLAIITLPSLTSFIMRHDPVPLAVASISGLALFLLIRV